MDPAPNTPAGQPLPEQPWLTEAGQFINFLLALCGMLSLAWLYWQALLRPAEHMLFINQTGPMIFVIEFLSLHASGMLQKLQPSQIQSSFTVREITANILGWRFSFLNIDLMLLGVYAVFALAFVKSFHNWVMPGMFMLSVLAKFFGRKASSFSDQKRLAQYVFAFLGVIFAAVIGQSLLARFFPALFVLAQKGLTHSAQPVIFLFWGACYYTLGGLIEFFGFAPAGNLRSIRNVVGAGILIFAALGFYLLG